MSNDIELTPMMKQFLDLKAKHPDAVMLFRCGDFYETYSTDAIIAAEILGITLTKRHTVYYQQWSFTTQFESRGCIELCTVGYIQTGNFTSQ